MSAHGPAENYLNFITTIFTDLLCWLHFVPLCSCSEGESIVCKKVSKLKKITFKFFKVM